MNEIDRKISMFRLLDIKVINDNSEVLYEGSTEKAPEDIKKLHYSKVNIGAPTNVYIN